MLNWWISDFPRDWSLAVRPGHSAGPRSTSPPRSSSTRATTGPWTSGLSGYWCTNCWLERKFFHCFEDPRSVKSVVNMELSLTKNLIDYKWKSTYLKWNLSGRLLQRLILWRFIISFCEVLIKLMFRDMSAGGQSALSLSAPSLLFFPFQDCCHSHEAILQRESSWENWLPKRRRVGYQETPMVSSKFTMGGFLAGK